MDTQATQKKNVGKSALLLAAVAAAFYVGFVIVTWIRD